MKQLQILLFIFFSHLAFCQSKKLTNEEINKRGASKINFIDNCNEAAKLAETDIKNKTIFLFLQSGEAPIIFYQDKIFEEKYSVNFYEQGCIGSLCAETYNYTIFEFLYKAYGKKWKSEIRKDTIGFKKWTKK